ncbi:MAG TPA: DUF4350 domain-containing protein [Gammaproteobacteria bacterium]
MKNKLPLILALVVIALLTYSFFYLFESYEEQEDLGWDKKARRNPYLAAEQFLTRVSIPVTSSDNFDKLIQLPPKGMVFISNSSQTLTRKRVDKLLEWVEQGGHLIVAAPVYDKDEKDFLLSRFEVENRKISKADESEPVEQPRLSEQLEKINKDILDNKQKDKEKNEQNNIDEAEVTTLRFNDLETSVRMHFSPESELTHPSFYRKEDAKSGEMEPTYWAGSEYGVHFMQFDMGYGLLSIISDNSIWKSNRIDVLDHAYLLWLLSNKNSEVVLLYGANMPSIFSFIWQYAAEMVLVMGLLLIAWLLYRSRRFGPVRQFTQAAHQSMAEHIRASGEYLWRDRKYELLIEPLRNEIRNRIQMHFPHFFQLNQKQQIELIQEHSSLPVDRIDSAFNRDINGDESEFMNIIIDLQKIRNTL